MKLAFRRRRIRIVDAETGEEIEMKIPFDPEAGGDRDAFLRFVWRLAQLSPDQLAALLDTRFGRVLFGLVTLDRQHPLNKYPATPAGYLQYLREHRPELIRRR
jgi:hypothetical protein